MRPHHRRSGRLSQGVLLGALAHAVACGGEGGSVQDGAPTDDGRAPDGDAPGVEIAAPAPPSLTPCPYGWQELVSGPHTVCEPFPVGPFDCGPGEAHFPGESGCLPIGDVCPPGRFPPTERLPSDRQLLFVDPGAVPGDGSRERPLTTLRAAMAQARPGGVLVLGKGTYREQLNISTELEVVGACAAQVHIALEGQAIRVEDGAHGKIANVSVGPAFGGSALFVARNASAELDGVEVRGINGLDVLGEVRARSLALRNLTRVTFGGVGGRITVERGVVEGCPAVEAIEGGEVELSGVAIRDGEGAEALGLVDAPEPTPMLLRLSEVVVQGVPCDGLAAVGAAAAVTLRDVLIRRTLPCPGGVHGAGVRAVSGAQVDAQRVRIDETYDAGLALLDNAAAVVSDLVVRSTVVEGESEFGTGVLALGNATASLERVAVERARRIAVAAVDHANLTARDLTVRDTQSYRVDGTTGWAIGAADGATVAVERAHLSRSRELGVASLYGAQVNLRDARVIETSARDCPAGTCPELGGSGALALAGATIRFERFELRDGPLCGLHVDQSDAELRSGRVRGFRIGACVADGSFDLTRLEHKVDFHDNLVALRTAHLPVPDVLGALAGLAPDG